MKKQLFISALAATLLLAGCVVAPTPYSYYDEPVYVEPPPPRVEYPGYAPVAGYVWIGGYWNWTGHRHEWVPGRWDAPHPGHRWVEPRWERDGNYWRQRRGGWEPETDGRTLHPVFGGTAAPAAPRYERRDERRDERRPDYDRSPAYRQERGSVPPPARGEPDSHTLNPVFTGGNAPPVRAEPPRRDNDQRPGPDAGRTQRDVRPAPAPRVDQDNRGSDRQRDDKRSGRRGRDDDR
jgi:hypothetical protein